MALSPRTTRLLLVAALAGALLVLFGGAAWAQSVGSSEDHMTRLINAERRNAGLPGLSTNVQLTGVARDWTPTMVRNDQISHNPRLGDVVAGPWTRLGENVGVARPGVNETPAMMVERLHRAFMNSPGHRANVLGDFNQIGIGAVWSNGTLWVTVNFMKGGETRPNAAVHEAAAVSRNVFAAAGGNGRRAQYVVLGRAEIFADALGGSGLAGDRAPVLFTNGPSRYDPNPALHSVTAAEVDRVLGGRGTVYLLGGTSAVSPRTERELAAAGYTVRRLSGASRVETSVRVAEEIVRVHGAPSRILVARADDWPDAVTGGAYAAASGSPLVLTGRNELHGAAAQFLARNRGAQVFALGGEAALSNGVVRSAGATRVAGRDRAATAVAVAEQLWGRTTAQPGDRYAAAPGYNGDAWAYALALAPWSAANTGPQLLVGNEVPPAVADYLQRLGYSSGLRGEVFSASAVPQPVRDRVRQLVGAG
jgi:putative cell wall-binding protein